MRLWDCLGEGCCGRPIGFCYEGDLKGAAVMGGLCFGGTLMGLCLGGLRVMGGGSAVGSSLGGNTCGMCL